MMKKFGLFFLLFFSVQSLSAQETPYCVVTFSETGRTVEGLTEYLWIIPLDESITSYHGRVKIYPFIVGEDVFLSDYEVVIPRRPYYLDMMQFPRLRNHNSYVTTIRQNRKLVQSIEYKYEGIKGKVRIKVYITPIKGNIEWTDVFPLNETSSIPARKVYFSNNFMYWEGFYNNKVLYDRIRKLHFEQVPYATDKRPIDL